jgi:hypothetical protein
MLFVTLSARFNLDRVEAGETGGFHEPAGNGIAVLEIASLAGEDKKNGLGNVLGELVVADLAAGGAINGVHMPPDKLGECLLGAGLDELAQ